MPKKLQCPEKLFPIRIKYELDINVYNFEKLLFSIVISIQK